MTKGNGESREGGAGRIIRHATVVPRSALLILTEKDKPMDKDVHFVIQGMVQAIRNRNAEAEEAEARRRKEQKQLDAMLRRQKRRQGRGHVMAYLVR